MNDSVIKDLMGLLSKQKHQVMHRVDSISVFDVVFAPLGEKLLADKNDQILEVSVCSKILVFSRVHNRGLNLICQWTHH
jgi:hypothetical protein